MVKVYAFIFCVGVAGVAFARTNPPQQQPTSAVRAIEMGRAITQEKCQSCHASGATGVSSNRQAPPLRTLSQKYPIDTLSEAFAEGVLVGHTNMPEFELEPAQVDALLTYIESIQSRPRSHKRQGKRN